MRGLLLRASPYAWLLLLLAALPIRRHRVLLIELSIMAVISGLVARLPSLDQWDRVPLLDMLRDREVPWYVSMAAVSAAALSWACFSAQARLRVHCPVCGYNLVGNTSGICPECGSPITSEIRERLAKVRPPCRTINQAPLQAAP